MTTITHDLGDLHNQLMNGDIDEDQAIRTIHSISNYYKTIGVRNKLKELGINKPGEFINKFISTIYKYDDGYAHDPFTSYVDYVMSKYTPQQMIEKSDYYDINIEDYKE